MMRWDASTNGVDTGLLEAYEVHWDGAMWSRGTFNGSSEEVVLNTGSAENRDDSWIEGTKRQDNTWGGDGVGTRWGASTAEELARFLVRRSSWGV